METQDEDLARVDDKEVVWLCHIDDVQYREGNEVYKRRRNTLSIL